MKHLQSKYEMLRAHILQKASLVAKKLEKRPGSREVTNQETALELYAETLTSPMEITPERQADLEALHERMTRLSQRQMELIRLRYFEARLWSEIAFEMGIDEREVLRLHKRALKKLKPA